MTFYNPNLKMIARSLRKNSTDAENSLWYFLRNKNLKGYQFYRQKMIGDYIVDFYCPKAKLVIEVDGGQHYSSPILESDKIRDEFLIKHGLRVRRVNNLDVLQNIEGVIEAILTDLEIPLNPPYK
jgi:very-short-patch-repair endonuclease